ncbi:uncharacterized protein TrAFT101_003095 [Trichoderma asperellum]|uniref:uncharacterized protein n=1 Tax=Trichoderma asperellum TaxID=101201 RepID=UPI003318B254|nr:hypothetical protein TrAFT101_003095 [Trichoderma asperellum]
MFAAFSRSMSLCGMKAKNEEALQCITSGVWAAPPEDLGSSWKTLSLSFLSPPSLLGSNVALAGIAYLTLINGNCGTRTILPTSSQLPSNSLCYTILRYPRYTS